MTHNRLLLGCLVSLSLGAATPPLRPGTSDVEEHLGDRLPLDLPLTDQEGHTAPLGQAFRSGKPVLLVFAYYQCPMLCDVVLRGVGDSLVRSGLHLGEDFRALTVSFDPRDTPAKASLWRERLFQALDEPHGAAAWPFLVGTEPVVRTLADRAGFRYSYDARTGEYGHPACVLVLTPKGVISRYLYGVKFRPIDVRLALGEAAQGRLGGIVDRVLLTCFRYSPSTRRYGVYVSGMLRGGAALVLLGVGGTLGLFWLGEWRRRRSRS